MSDQKKIFISYSWDSPEHKAWVKKFSDDLQARLGDSFEVLLDQNQRRGTSLSRFMKKGLKDAVKVLIIGTPKYKEKSEASYCVAYETSVITTEMRSNIDTTKFYPILRAGTFETSFPIDIQDRMGDDLSDDNNYEEQLKTIVDAIIKEYPIPQIKKTESTPVTSIINIEQQKPEDRKNIENSANVTEQSIASLDGVLFSSDKTRLIYVPKDKIGSLIIPNSVTEIGESAFYGCTGLTSIKIPERVTKIGESAFYGCTNLTSIKIPNSVTKIEKSAFYGCTNLTSIKIPNSVTVIASHAFHDCTCLSLIEIPNNVTKIGIQVFYGCTHLTSIEIPDSVTKIGDWAFRECSSLISIKIPDSVTEIGDWAFDGCSSMEAIHLKHKAPMVFSENAFSGLNRFKAKLYVPKGSSWTYMNIEYYKVRFKDRIIEEKE